jgi:hypothetical protein
MKTPKLYYIQNGFVGNAMCWWRPDGKGYTTDIKDAGRYSEEDAKEQARMRFEDIAWPCDYIDENEMAHKTTISFHYLNCQKRFKGKSTP